MTSFPEQLYEAGYTDLVSVIPPGAALTPTSRIPSSAAGKAPGIRLATGLYTGYTWRTHKATIEDVRKWVADGSNVGLRADRFPGLDIDVSDATVAQMVEDYARGFLGAAPIRTGRAPKRLLLYRTDVPFGRIRLHIKQHDAAFLVELLGRGQQFVASGVHPGTLLPYTWVDYRPASDLCAVSRERAVQFFGELRDALEATGCGDVTIEGDGRERAAIQQVGLVAPSTETLRNAVALIPNTNDLFVGRDAHIKFGYAIRAACGENEQDGYEIFADWAARWEGNDRYAKNDPEEVRANWRRMRPPYAVGWSYIAEWARQFGFNDAALEFDPVGEAAGPEEAPLLAPAYSDQWLADEIVERHRHELRFVPQTGKYLVWDSVRWQPDGDLLAENLINGALRGIADTVARQGATEKDRAAALARARAICSADKARAVASVARSNRAIAVNQAALDADPWLLNTPAGIVDLRSGKIGPPNPDRLCTKTTKVAPDASGEPTAWYQFLAEATDGDNALVAFLQQLAGYMLTGDTQEQQLTFVYGPGGSGKGTFKRAIYEIMADYATAATMATFIESKNERHSTDIASLNGARLVVASETQAGRAWDEALVKQLTGEDPVKARFMRQDNITFLPQFKLLFLGNHRPTIRNVDTAMRRRLYLVPFNHEPPRVDPKLKDRLRAEYPRILWWMIQGCLAWQRAGRLEPPQSVLDTTRQYFTDEDTVAQWIEDCATEDVNAFASTTALFQSWQTWAHARGTYVGSSRWLGDKLAARRLPRIRKGGERGFGGVRLTGDFDIGA